eukprot:scaffold3.g6615.t1
MPLQQPTTHPPPPTLLVPARLADAATTPLPARRQPIAAAFGLALLLGVLGAALPGTHGRSSFHLAGASGSSAGARFPRGGGWVRNPLLPHLPDPFLLEWEGKWYAYGSVGNGSGGPGTDGYQIGFRVWVGSPDMRNWTDGGLALTPDGAGRMGREEFWAPELYVSAAAACRQRWRRGLAAARVCADRLAAGALRSLSGPLRDEWMIDSHVFEDDNGTLYMYFGYWGGLGMGVLTPDLKNLSGTRHLFNHNDTPEAWVSEVNEGPFVLKHNGTYYLVYSGNPTGYRYGVGYATADSPARSASSSPAVVDVHALCAGSDKDRLAMAYHMAQSDTHVRPMCVSPVAFVPDPGGGPDRLTVQVPALEEQHVL